MTFQLIVTDTACKSAVPFRLVFEWKLQYLLQCKFINVFIAYRSIKYLRFSLNRPLGKRESPYIRAYVVV